MDTKENNQDELKNYRDSAQEMIKYLRRKAENHNHYKSYGSLEGILKIKNNKVLYLNDGKEWNDVLDSENFNSDDSVYKNFGKCFSFSQEESVAMWMLYGGINNMGGMIDFTRKGMHNILEIETVNVGKLDESKGFISLFELGKNQFEIYMTDVIYYKQNDKSYYIKRADESVKNLSSDIFDSLDVCKKSYPWQYENECRLIVKIRREFLDEDVTHIKIDLSQMDLGKSFERIYRNPNYPTIDSDDTLPSKLTGTINWSLCDKEKCVYKGV